jgi:predicted Fe-S protein YdhL (DUF1289 family)
MTNDYTKNIKLTNSPCVRNCCLDETDICLGCFRHLDEIVGWRNYSLNEKEQIIQLCQQRRDNK